MTFKKFGIMFLETGCFVMAVLWALAGNLTDSTQYLVLGLLADYVRELVK